MRRLSSQETRGECDRGKSVTKVTVVSTEIVPRLHLHLVACADIGEGETIVACTSEQITSTRTWRTVQIDHNRHLRNELLDYVDHSCDSGSEVELAQDFECTCASPACLGHLKGGFYLTAEQMQWAIGNRYCTRFLEEQFTRLLGKPDGRRRWPGRPRPSTIYTPLQRVNSG